METYTTVKAMLAGNKIVVPAYQRAYSWGTATESSEKPLQVNTFINDLEDFSKSHAPSYYFGHFLYKKHSNTEFDVVDGQQRLTTIVIFLCALFGRLKAIRPLTEKETEYYEDMVKRNSSYRLSTVGYDNRIFKEYVIDQTKRDTTGADTVSVRRIIGAFDYFRACLAEKDESYLTDMLHIIAEACCTTHCVEKESDAVQMFIFQNDRGKKPSNLEIIKARFMYQAHLYGKESAANLIEDIKERFESIYRSISRIEDYADEDDILLYTLRIHYNNLGESGAIDRINKSLAEEEPIGFIREFTRLLACHFEYLTAFFGPEAQKHMEIHALVTLTRLGGLSLAIPFVLKAYGLCCGTDDLCRLCSALESIVLRHRLIGTRAEIISRLHDVFRNFTPATPSVQPIIDRINWMKTTSDWWWGHWNNGQLTYSIQGGINHNTARYILWKYENHLESLGKQGYAGIPYTAIQNPELEHIAPRTPTDGKPVEAGYCEYDEEFINQYINCLGNYLLLSKKHNCSVGNRPFDEKRDSYTHLAQQREVREMTAASPVWDKEKIRERKTKLSDFITETF